MDTAPSPAPVAARRASEKVPIFRTAATRDEMMAIYDAAMRRWPVPYEERLVPTRYGKTHVVISGDPASPPLLLLHPMGVGAFVWSSIIGPLSAHRRTYALDTIGDVGKSVLEEPRRHPSLGSEYSEWLDDVHRALDVPAADLVAGSMGGWIAMNHAIGVPRRVRRLVLLGPMGLPPWSATIGVLGPMMSYVLHPTDAKLERIISRSLGRGERVNLEFRQWMRLLGKCAPRVGQPYPIAAGALRRIQAPTLVFLGGRDGLVGPPSPPAERAQRYIPNCEIEILPRAGHVMSVDEPETVAPRMIAFLEQH